MYEGHQEDLLIVESPGPNYKNVYPKRAAMQYIMKNCKQFKIFVVADACELAHGEGEKFIKLITALMR